MDFEWEEECEENPLEEPVPVPEEEPREQVQAPPIWPEQHVVYSSFVTSREGDGRRQFRDFVMSETT